MWQYSLCIHPTIKEFSLSLLGSVEDRLFTLPKLSMLFHTFGATINELINGLLQLQLLPQWHPLKLHPKELYVYSLTKRLSAAHIRDIQRVDRPLVAYKVF